jgi:hypothetical protein
MVEEAWIPAIEAQELKRKSVYATVGTPSVSQLPSSPSIKMYSETLQATSMEFNIMLLY